ncbi:unnamed protein product [Urochloa decumbens]|uniref:Receptor kinase-like protein Xa21 n=1 Tax=Urochloa decumbens TaxID=240449 RepID=A0ABC9CN99_9POAL
MLKQTQKTSLPCSRAPLAAMLLFHRLFLLIFVSLEYSGCYMALASVSIPATSTSNTTDHLALISFKSLVTSDPKQALVSWGNQSIPICQWRGVTCGRRGLRRGRVVALNLAELGLIGRMSPALGNLTYMRWLSLESNHFDGILPPELGNLQELTDLNLGNNTIGGEIPLALSSCTSLVNISLYGNKLQGAIPSKFSSLHNLKVLSLGQNRLTGTFPPEFGSLMNLELLSLEYNNLTGDIPDEIGNLVNLIKLGLGYNQFLGAIPASLGNLSALTILSMYSNNLIGSIPPLQDMSSMGNLSSLREIDLYQNGLVGQIPESLGNLELLTTLALSVNNLVGSIPQALGNIRSLKNLYLAYNMLQGELPLRLFNISSLEIFDVSNNFLNGSFPPDITSNLPKLKAFGIMFNGFHGMIPPSLCNNSMLVILQTSYNFLSGTIPQCLGLHQQSLYSATFSANQFHATKDADWAFLSSLTNSTNLTMLDISDNNFQGALPHSVGNLSKHLLVLDVNHNKITGTIPEGIGNLVNLETLYMKENFLEGSIPSSFSKMSKLNHLSLQNNKLSGSIPVSLGNLTNLAVLTLQDNALGGLIPSTLSSCPLRQLDLSYNNLTGWIPEELFLIPTLSDSMCISHNLLSGRLPSDWSNLQNLAALDFSDNRLYGEIPSSIGELKSLEYINASGNILQGEIPSSLGKLKGLLVVDLSHNNLSGTIPEFLGTLRGLYALNISFNRFEGPVPQDGIFLNATAISLIGDDGLCGGIPQLKLPPCSKSNFRKSSKFVIIVSTGSVIVFIALLVALFTFYYRRRFTKANLQTPFMNKQYMRVSHGELVRATNGFTSENLIGAGSFGSVYKGIMRRNDQQEVIAVKVLNLTRHGASQSFIAECETLRCVRHRNLVKLLTVCSSIDHQGHEFKALVYEFLPNGNLDQWLHNNFLEDGIHKTLDISARLQITIDVAYSLEYLHQHKPLPIIHCDLKPSNVLLDGDLVAHVSDFGLARFLHQDLEQSNSWVSMRGTIGYAAPEYGLGNEVSIQGDVYSYGILLLEMFTGKKPTDSEFGEAFDLRKYVQMALAESAANVIDKNLLQQAPDIEARSTTSHQTREIKISCIASIMQVGISCSEETPMDRAQIGDALKELETIRDKLHKDLLLDECQGIRSIPLKQ